MLYLLSLFFSYADFRSKSFRKNYLDNMSLTSLSSVQKFSIKDDPRLKGQCYMGICLPRVLIDLFPDNQVVSRRLSYVEKSFTWEGKLIFYTNNFQYFKYSFIDNLSEENETNTFELDREHRTKTNRIIRHDTWACLSCSRKRRRRSNNTVNNQQSSNTNGNSFLITLNAIIFFYCFR